MATQLVHEDRVHVLNDQPTRDGDYVLYWMQQSQRAKHNDALEYAVRMANDLEQRLLVAFGLMDDYPEANARHYQFMLEGLQETQQDLHSRKIKFVLQFGHPAEVAIRLSQDAAAVVCDFGYLRHQRQWRQQVAEKVDAKVVAVEADAVVPVETASDKVEYAARTIRRKINERRDEFLVQLKPNKLKKDSLNLAVKGESLDDPAGLVETLDIDQSVRPVPQLFRGGPSEAERRLKKFCRQLIGKYDDMRSHPETDYTTNLSPYLHFGQISPVDAALRVAAVKGHQKATESFLEELLVRRGLSQNFVYFEPKYDQFNALPDWARETLSEHAEDKREATYTRRQLEAARTHDEYWNAAMREMKHTGYMHNYMRMYWGKKILEWSKNPKQAHRTTLAINNKYFLDGRDANSFANVAWVFGQHDRAWQERKIYGKVRTMKASGLERKCDIESYVRKVDQLVAQVSD